MDNKQDKGFTLVELLIVIVILGILATVTVFAVPGITDQGQQSACDADQTTLETAVETWFAQYGGTAIPGDVTDTLNGGDVTGMGAQEALVEAGFMVAPSTNYTMTNAGAIAGTGECAPAPAPAP